MYKSLNDVNKFKSVTHSIEICNVGTSHGMNAFYYEDIDMKGFNFALQGQGFYYDHKLLKQYADNISDNAVVLIPVSYMSFHIGFSDNTFKNINPRYYSFLDKEYINDFNYFDYIRYYRFPVLSAGENIIAIFSDKKNVKNMWELRRKNRFEKSELDDEGMEKALTHLRYIENGRSYVDENIDELQNIVDFCRENSFIPVLVTTPFTEYYNVCFSESAYKAFYSIVNEFAEKNSLEYMDYSHNEKYSKNYDLFRDTDHLNLVGRKIFTKEVITDLKIKGVI